MRYDITYTFPDNQAGYKAVESITEWAELKKMSIDDAIQHVLWVGHWAIEHSNKNEEVIDELRHEVLMLKLELKKLKDITGQ